MKPLHLNLAARPYRDYRPVYAVVVVMSLLVAFLMLKNVETYYEYIHDTQSTRDKISKVDAQAEQERRRTAVVRNQLDQIDLNYLNRQTRFVNAQLAERAFSWSELLDQLETILTDDVRLTSVTPTFTDDGSVMLALSFESRKADGLIDTLNRFNASQRFENAFPNQEVMQDGGTYTFGVGVSYFPATAKVVKR